jgi:hypothetical protein
MKKIDQKLEDLTITTERLVKASLRSYKIAKLFYKFKRKNFEKRAHFVSNSVRAALTVWKDLGYELKITPITSREVITFDIKSKGLVFESNVCFCSREECKEVLINYLGFKELDAQSSIQEPNLRGQCAMGSSCKKKYARIFSSVFIDEVSSFELIIILIHELVHQIDYIKSFAKENNIKLKNRRLNDFFKMTLSESLKDLCRMA